MGFLETTIGTKIEAFDHNLDYYIRRKNGEPAGLQDSQLQPSWEVWGVGTSCVGDLLQDGLVKFTKWHNEKTRNVEGKEEKIKQEMFHVTYLVLIVSLYLKSKQTLADLKYP